MNKLPVLSQLSAINKILKKDIDKDGYGNMKVKGKDVKAHRLSVKLSGREIAGKVVRHKCDNPACVNPDHLETGSHQDNVDDMLYRGRKKTKLTASDILDIRNRAIQGHGGNISDLSQEYDVGVVTINNIVRRKTWTHI